MGTKKGNINASKNGTRIDRRRLVVGELGKQLVSAKREGRAYRRAIESEVMRVKGDISTVDSHHIDTASACCLHAAICRHLLRTKMNGMTTADILACSREITKAKKDRDTAVKALGLDHRRDPWSVIDALPAPKSEEQNEQ